MGFPMIFVPKTSKQCYVSSIVALNIHSPNDTGDWHTSDTLRPSNYPLKYYIWGDGQYYNTNPFLGDVGIIDGTERLRRMGYEPENTPVWVADHSRACVDYLYIAVIKTGSIGRVILREWFPATEDMEAVYELIDRLEPHLNKHELENLIKWKKRNPIE